MIKVTFWGVRGSVACSGPDFDMFGGATSCVTLQSENINLILDAGTGISDLGKVIDQAKPCHLLFSHVHYDHYIGLPFFAPLWGSDFELEVYAGPLQGFSSTDAFIDNIFQAPQFPIERCDLPAKVNAHDLTVGKEFNIGDEFKVKTFALNHPNGATGYRIENNGKSVCYITDHEHTSDVPDPELVEFVRGADIMIYDSTYALADYESHKGWGHSTWNAGVALAESANVAKFVGFHHAHIYSDSDMVAIERDMQKVLPSAIMARQGMVLDLY